MRAIRWHILAVLAPLAINPLVFAGPLASVLWPGAGLECIAAVGNPAQCSVSGTAPDPSDPSVQDPISASAYAFEAPNVLTFDLSASYLRCPSDACGALPFGLDVIGEGTLRDQLALSQPAPPGSYAVYSITNLPVNAGDFVVGGSFWTDPYYNAQVSISGTFLSDQSISQSVSGKSLDISATWFESMPSLPGSDPQDLAVTYSIQNIEVFDKDGTLIPETFTQVPEPSDLVLLSLPAGILLLRALSRFSGRDRRRV